MPKTISVVCAAIHHHGRVLIGKRPPGGDFGEKWEFPGGKIEPGERPELALVREIREELALEIRPLHTLGREVFGGADRVIDLELFWAVPMEPVSNVEAREHTLLCWADVRNIASFDFALPDVPLLPRVIDALTRKSRLC